MKKNLLVAFGLMAVLLLSTACSSPTPEAEAEEMHMDEDGHTHGPEEHMDGAHGVPAEASALVNPIAATDESLEKGATVFATSCAVCHGEKGLGDGPGAAGLDPKPANLTLSHVQGLSDGAFFYIVSHGKPKTPMPAWEGVLSEDERWNLVNFLRTFGAEGGEEHHDDDHAHEDEHSD